MGKQCTEWKREDRMSGSHPWVRRCGPIKAEIMLWKPGVYSAVIRRRDGGPGLHVYGKTLAAAKSAASRVMNRIAGR